MYKTIILIILAFLIKAGLNAQLLDTAPTGKKNRLPVEGGNITMKIDSLTPLPEMINKLNDSWEFIETGKAYWIGYTNDMFSIASHEDEAVSALANFFKTTTSKNGKIGAIYTLHLIGIDRQIVGRFTEHFVNLNARSTLLQLLSDHEYTRDIVELLMRDPWQSDVPYLLDILQTEADDKVTWPIINALCQYRITELPYNNILPKNIESLAVHLNVKNENVLERDFDFNAQIKEALKEFGNKYPDFVKVDSSLYADDLSPYYKTKLPCNLSIGGLLSSLDIDHNLFGFSEIGCKLQYYYEDKAIHFCTIRTAQRRLNAWWSDLPKDSKEKFK